MAAPAYRSVSAQNVKASAAASPAPAQPASAVAPSVAPAVAVVAAEDIPAGAVLESLPVGLLRVDGDTQRRQKLDQEAIDRYADVMISAGGWGPFPAAAAVYDGADYWLFRGFHRRAAFLVAAGGVPAADVPAVPVLVVRGDLRLARLLSTAENTRHGVPRTNDDKAASVDLLLKDPEWASWSDGKIAAQCGVSAPYVGKRRRLLAQSAAVAGSVVGVPAERIYTDRYGNTRTMNTSGIAAGNRERAAASAAASGAAAAGGGSSGGGSVVASSAAGSKQAAAALGKCGVCGRPLSDPDHAAAGCGPVCSAKRAAGGAAADDGAASEDPGAAASGAAAGGAGLGPVAGRLRARLLGLVDDLADYVQITGDIAGAEQLRRVALAAVARLAGEG